MSVEDIVREYALHFRIPPPNVRLGCEGCPHYVGGVCTLGYVACYDPLTDTITFSSEEWVREEVVLHELLHYAVDIGRLGYPVKIGVECRTRTSKSLIILGTALLLTSMVR